MHPQRAIDANGNRAAEGLRVLEDAGRMLLDDADLSARAKALRHRLRAALPARVVADRDTAGDVGTTISESDEGRRASLAQVVRANAARVAEALRAVEEFAKLSGEAEPARVSETLRYGLYDLERDLLARLPVTRLWRERLYVLVDTGCTDDPVGVAGEVAAGGAGVIQLRAKGLGERAYRELPGSQEPGIRELRHGHLDEPCRAHGDAELPGEVLPLALEPLDLVDEPNEAAVGLRYGRPYDHGDLKGVDRQCLPNDPRPPPPAPPG